MFLSLGLLQTSASNFSSYLLFRLYPSFSLCVSGLSQLEISLHPDLTITVSGKPQRLYQTSKFLSGLQGTKSYCSVWGGVDIRSLVYMLVSLHLGSKNAHPGVQSGTGASAGKVCHLIHNQEMRCADSLEHTPPRLFYQALKKPFVQSYFSWQAFATPDPHLTPFCHCQASPRLWSILLPPSQHLPLTPQLLEICIPPSSTPLTLLLEDHQ